MKPKSPKLESNDKQNDDHIGDKSINIDIFRKQSAFEISFEKYDHNFNVNMPEFAFIGRSNVGKSSLINFLLSRNKLARTSKTPGRTTTINIFSLDKSIYLVDLPGYGYAKRSKAMRNNWSVIVDYYLRTSENLRLLFILVDARVGFKELDYDMVEYCEEHDIPYMIVLTKSDKADKKQLQTLSAAPYDTISTSVVKNFGKEELQKAIINALDL